ncbi:MAG TPA: hypothetical protein VJ224_04205 [Thermoplasmata archaeon]|nr:hypothetical protein [Thermoplasmata archaeon]
MPSIFMMGSLAVGVANIVLASVLLFVYRGIFARTRAPFSVALLLFSGAFLAHNLLVVYSFATMMAIVPGELDPYLFGIGAFEAFGLGAMLWTATR